jgi:hypothetical protein
MALDATSVAKIVSRSMVFSCQWQMQSPPV